MSLERRKNESRERATSYLSVIHWRGRKVNMMKEQKILRNTKKFRTKIPFI